MLADDVNNFAQNKTLQVKIEAGQRWVLVVIRIGLNLRGPGSIPATSKFILVEPAVLKN